MTATIIPIEISDSSINGSSLLLATIIFIAFIIFTKISCSKLYAKLYPYSQYSPNFINALTQNTMQNIKNVITNVTNDAEIQKIAEYNTQIKEWSDTINKYEIINSSIANIINSKFTNLQDYFSSKLQDLSGNLTYYTNAINKLNSMSDDNIRAFESAYYGYQSKLQNYIDGLVTTIGKVATQIANSSIIPGLHTMVGPLTNVYLAIYGTLKDNLPFINDIYPDFSIDSVPTLPDTPIQANLSSSFKNSTAILSSAGYK